MSLRVGAPDPRWHSVCAATARQAHAHLHLRVVRDARGAIREVRQEETPHAKVVAGTGKLVAIPVVYVGEESDKEARAQKERKKQVREKGRSTEQKRQGAEANSRARIKERLNQKEIELRQRVPTDPENCRRKVTRRRKTLIKDGRKPIETRRALENVLNSPKRCTEVAPGAHSRYWMPPCTLFRPKRL